ENADRSIDELIDAVCSPGGTTIEGMKVLRNSSVKDDVAGAVDAAEERSEEITEEVSEELES
ncbi:MAG: pyrroline-5-carboxylate reductase dimerization domain-containing protein, partial [Halobacteria archaeon]|nr:pyrroline-5-carboxylate reductase dimerization domain-containing protein [Halobacteria archaeon]